LSQLLIQSYLNQLADLRKVSGTQRESVVREAFKDLLKGWARSHDLVFVPEYEISAPTKERRYVDGALLHALRMPFGYWEAKDDEDDLDAEIDYKRRRGYRNSTSSKRRSSPATPNTARSKASIRITRQSAPPRHTSKATTRSRHCFADYKDKVIDLLMRVTTVSVETQEIVEAMRVARRGS